MSDLISQQLFYQLENSNLNKTQIEQGKETLTKIENIMSDFRSEKARISQDGDLSKQGQATKLAGLSATTGEQLQNIIHHELATFDSRIAQLSEQIRPQNPSSNELLEHAMQKEVRDKLYSMDPLEVLGLYKDLSISGADDLTMRAIEQAPASFPLIDDPAVIEAGREARGRRQRKEEAELLDQLKSWRATIEAAYMTAKSELNLPDLTIEEMAKTGTA